MIFIILAGIQAKTAQAQDFTLIRKIPSVLTDDFSIESPGHELAIKIPSQEVPTDLYLKAMSLIGKDDISSTFTLPNNREPASDLYLIKFSKGSETNFSVVPEITLNYSADNKYKEVYCYDWSQLQFQRIDSTRDTLKHLINIYWKPGKSMLCAIFNEPEIIGMASWYVHPQYRTDLMAASRDFAKGSQIKVKNLYNNKEVVVTIRDYGPKKCSDWTDREHELMGPCQDRILDLSKTAFLKLATSTGQGIISQIQITPIN